MGNLFQELSRRKVIKVAIAYSVGGWALLQVAEVVSSALALPAWTLTFILYLLIIGFPVTLLLAWMYDITSKGFRQDSVDLASGRKGLTGKALVVTALVMLGLGYMSYIAVISDQRFAMQDNYSSIIVLPFANLSGDPEQEYFVAGVHNGLISTLSRLSSLRVISQRTSNSYKDTHKSVSEIADEMDVNAVLEGSVMQEGGRVEINVQLIDAETESAVWSESFTGPVERTVALQGEIVRAAANWLDAGLTMVEEADLLNIADINPESYELYLKGMFEINKSNPVGWANGIAILENSVSSYPGDAFAWLALANAYILLGHNTEGVRDWFIKARSAAEKARILDPRLAGNYDVMASVKLYMEWDWQGAEENFLQAQTLNPNLAWSYYHYAWYLVLHDRMDEAITAHIKARDLDPMFPLYSAWLGGLYIIAEDWEKAIVEAERAFALNSQDVNALWVLGDAYFGLGRMDEALSLYQQLAQLNPHMSWQLGRAYAMLGRTEEALQIALELEKDGLSPQEAIGLLSLWPYLGNMNRAIELLEYEDMHTWLPWTRVMGHFQALRDDPRYHEFLQERLMLPPVI